MCGEHADRAGVGAVGAGSSPHVRGARPRRCPAPSRSGIIPACAGSTSALVGLRVGDRDHPRMCGEHLSRMSPGCGLPGSSPHVRGALRPRKIRFHIRGIIPACAGSTLIGGTIPSQWRDHPRMCGEHTFDDCAFPWYQGSSPHVRGALAMSSKACLVFGIIPACAGSTNSSMVFPVDKRDHPRMCGEHGRVVTVNGNVKGSSPHVRGAP